MSWNVDWHEDGIERLHFPEGWIERSGKVRACCHCGWATTPRVNRKRALDALYVEHGYTGRGRIATECAICGQTVKAHGTDLYWSELRNPWEVFGPLVDGNREVYVCRDQKACGERYDTNRRADLLKCGCFQSSVRAIGHYHETGCDEQA